MDSVVPRVRVGVQERVASGEHLCVGAVRVPAVGSGCQVWMRGICMCASSAALQGEQRLCVSLFLAENRGASVRCHREQWVPCGLPCVCVAAFTSVRHCCVPAHLQSLGKAVQCSSTKLWQRACAGKHPWEHPGLQGRDPLPGWNSPSGSCTASPPGLRFSFLAFPQLPLLTGSSMLCPGNQLPLTTQGGNSFLSSSLVFSHTKSQKVKKKLGGQPELDLFPFHVLIPLFNPQELHYKLTDFHPNPQTSTPKPRTLQTRLSSHPSHGPSQADTAQVGQLKVTELGESSPCSWEYGEAPAAAATPV